jgi:hypothetical protein
MYQTLGQLKKQIETKIEQQGEEAPCFVIIRTKEHVCYYDLENNQISHDLDDVERVFEDLEDKDWLHKQVDEAIDDSISELGMGKVVID